MYKLEAEKQKMQFLDLCSESDKKRINGLIDISVRDFERIIFLLDMLDFKDYLVEFENEHLDLLEELGKTIENDYSSVNFQAAQRESDVYEEWYTDFFKCIIS